MTSRALCLVAVLGAVGCQPVVDVGADTIVDLEGDCGVTPPTMTCPAFGSAMAPPTLALRPRLLGRWSFCGGERRYTGRGPLLGFFGGSGVEFYEENGTLRFVFLQNGGATRKVGAWANGTVTLAPDGDRLVATLEADDGVRTAWRLSLLEPQVLRNDASDVWHFVPAP